MLRATSRNPMYARTRAVLEFDVASPFHCPMEMSLCPMEMCIETIQTRSLRDVHQAPCQSACPHINTHAMPSLGRSAKGFTQNKTVSHHARYSTLELHELFTMIHLTFSVMPLKPEQTMRTDADLHSSMSFPWQSRYLTTFKPTNGA